MFEQLAVGQGPERTSVEKRADVVADAGVRMRSRHLGVYLNVSDGVRFTSLLRRGVADGVPISWNCFGVESEGGNGGVIGIVGAEGEGA